MKNNKADETSKLVAGAITSGISGSLEAKKLTQTALKSAKPAGGIKFKGIKLVSRPRTPAQKFMNTISFGLFD